jgi:hypothetical protein
MEKPRKDFKTDEYEEDVDKKFYEDELDNAENRNQQKEVDRLSGSEDDPRIEQEQGEIDDLDEKNAIVTKKDKQEIENLSGTEEG